MSKVKTLPKGWEVKKLGEIGKIFNGNSINATIKKKKYLNVKKGMPYIATKDISYANVIDYGNGVRIPFEEKSSFKFIPENTILICAEGGSAGRKIAFTNQEVCFGNKLFALIVKKNISSKYIYYFYFSNNFQKNFQGQMTGIIGGVSIAKFKKLNIPFPPISEQKRITSILDKAFVEIAKAKTNAEQNLKNAKELFESYLQNVFENKGDDWKGKTLGDILSSPPKNGWSPPAKFHSVSGIPVLTLSAVTGFIFKKDSVKYTSAPVKNDAYYWLNEGDLLITRSNTPELVGHIAICECLNVKTIYPDLMMKINPNNSIVNTQFLYYQLRSPKLREIITGAAHGANPTMKKINKQDVQSFEISYPSLLEQKQIVKKLNSLSVETKKLEVIYQNKINDLVELKKSILQKAFNGEL